MLTRERAGEIRSRKEVNWEKTTDLVNGSWARMVLRWETRAAILAEESEPILRREIRGG